MRAIKRMTRWIALGLVVGGASASPVAALTASYHQKVTTPDGQEVASHVTIQDTNFRAETELDGIRTIVLKNDVGIFNYLPEQGEAVKLPSLQAVGPGMESPERFVDTLRANHAKPLGTETVDGYVCDVYEFTDPNGQGQQTRAWVWKDKQFPVKMELTDAQGTVLIELSAIDLEAAIAPDAFTLPTGTQVMDINALPHMLQDAPPAEQ